jgi:hypothetical protein
MTKKQQAQFDSSIRAKNFITENHDVLVTNPEFVLLLVIFTDLLTQLEEARLVQAADITIYKPDKKLQKILMAAIVIKYSKLGAAKAYLLHNIQLKEALDKAVSYISKADDDTAADRATVLKTIMKDNLLLLTNIIQANIDEMTTAITNFINIKPVPIEKIKERKAQGTDPIPQLSEDMEECKKQIGHIVESAFNSLFVSWKDLVKIGTPAGTKNLSVSVQYLDEVTGARLRRVKATLVSNAQPLVKKSTKFGYIKGYSLPEGNYTLTSELAGYETDTSANLLIKLKGTLKLIIRMKKII